MYLGKKSLLDQKKQNKLKATQQQKSNEEYTKQLAEIFENFQKNLHVFAEKYKDQISKNPDFRDKFNEICDKMDVNPMLSRKNIFTELGFGDFYNELAVKILDICAKRKHIDGGITTIPDIVNDFRKIYNIKITKKDVVRGMQTINSLGGCSVQNNYVYTVPIEMSQDFTTLLEVAEKTGYVNEAIMQKEKNWPAERFYQKIEIMQREGLVWVDKKVPGTASDYYFPSLLDNYYSSLHK